MLADAAAEHDRVGSSQDRQVGAQVLASPVAEDLHRQSRARILPFVREQVPHVAAPAGQAEQPGALVEPSLHLRRGHTLRAREIADERGIDIADRVPITRPSKGVRPMEVSIDRPSLIAAAEQPFPR